jgi:CBS domain containing-hemolysin-like protein
MILDIVITLFLVFLNGFFVAAEFAIVKVRASQIELMIKAGSKTAEVTKGMLNKLDAYLSATQLGITIASLGLGYYGKNLEHYIVQLFEVLGLRTDNTLISYFPVVFAFIIITVLHIVFGELAPKSLAIQKPEAVTLAVTHPLKWFYQLLKPFIWALNSFANWVLKLLGVVPVHGEGVHSPEEIRYLVEQGKDSGTMESYNYDIIKNAFDFSERTARQVMVPRTRMVALNANLDNDLLIERIIEEGFSRMPIFRDSLDNIIGIVYVKDILVLLRKQQAVDVKALIRPIHFVPQNQKITRLLRQFQRDRIHMAVVVDEYGGTEGIITMEDIMEELVGEIQDEYDNEIPIVEKVNEAEYRILASAPIADVNEHLPHPLTESKDYESLSGMLSFNLGRIPDANEKLVLDDYEFTILKRTRNNVTLVQIRDLIEAENE